MGTSGANVKLCSQWRARKSASSSRNQVPSPPNGSAAMVSGCGSTSTPNSSISNMACLPESEDRLSNPATNMTPSPPPPTPPTTSTTAIYARVNPNLKRDKTNNNNFTSTFSSTSTAQFQPATIAYEVFSFFEFGHFFRFYNKHFGLPKVGS